MERIGIVIANTGSPDEPTPEAVRSYLSAFLTDKRIMPMNPLVWKPILNLCILPTRSKKSAQKYSKIWTAKGSPLTVTQASLADRLEKWLQNSGMDAKVLPASSYGSPNIDNVIAHLAESDCSRITVLPLYPQSAFSTTHVVADRAKQAAGSSDIHLIESYCESGLYIQAITDSICRAGFGEQEGDRLLFAFHAVPMHDINNGDTYNRQVYATVKAVAAKLGLTEERWAAGFQCKFDKSRKWLKPSTKETLSRLCEQPGWSGRLFAVAPNFSIDCLETLFDIDIQLREYFSEKTGLPADRFVYVPCLNDSNAQVQLLASLLME